MQTKIRVLLVDDHTLVRKALAGHIQKNPDITIVGEASDGKAGVNLARELRPDIVLMDISMPVMDGVEATRIIHSELPDTHIIGLSMFESDEQGEAMIDAGAVAYLTKSGPPSALFEQIHAWSRRAKAA